MCAGSQLTLVIDAISERNIKAVVPAALCSHLIHVACSKHTERESINTHLYRDDRLITYCTEAAHLL